MTDNELQERRENYFANKRNVVAPKGKHHCPYCGQLTDGEYWQLLCAECRERFGRALYCEL